MSTTLTLEAAAPPLTTDDQGVVFVEGTRVTLDTMVRAYQNGASAEQIADDYSSVSLKGVYATIAYYLAHSAEVEAYLRRRDEERAAVRAENERRFEPRGVLERLRARNPGTEK